MQMVHNGFHEAWRSVQPAVEELIQDAAAYDACGNSADWKVYFAGHSLGGALATLATASAAAQGCCSNSATTPSNRAGCILITSLWIFMPASEYLCMQLHTIPTNTDDSTSAGDFTKPKGKSSSVVIFGVFM